MPETAYIQIIEVLWNWYFLALWQQSFSFVSESWFTFKLLNFLIKSNLSFIAGATWEESWTCSTWSSPSRWFGKPFKVLVNSHNYLTQLNYFGCGFSLLKSKNDIHICLLSMYSFTSSLVWTSLLWWVSDYRLRKRISEGDISRWRFGYSVPFQRWR